MTESILLSVSNLGKCYRDWGSELKRFASWFNPSIQPDSVHWSLQDISFTIKRGEAIGIVGHNGAGKSTLLKMIAGTLTASTGRVECHGRIAAILELGMGFHPDFTGRENVYHSAGLMGFSRDRVNEVIQLIEEFAEIGEYFDQAVRTYSSGMQVRVAFAVATAFQPDILIVDEALSVGDAYFQHKSFARIRQFLDQGTSLILVSHDNSAIMSLCHKALLLDQGRLIAEGDPENVINVYSARTAQHEKDVGLDEAASATDKQQIRSGSGSAVIESWRLLDGQTRMQKDVFNVGQTLLLTVECHVNENLNALGIGMMIRDRYGLPVFGTNSFLNKAEAVNVKKGQRIGFEICTQLMLGKGNYSITLAVEDHEQQRLDWIDLAAMFEVSQTSQDKFIGTACLPTKMTAVVKEEQSE